MYRVLTAFVDLKDGRHFYEAGETYPRKGLTVSRARLDELAGRDNRMGHPLIAFVEEPVEKAEKPVERAEKTAEKAEKPVRRRVKAHD